MMKEGGGGGVLGVEVLNQRRWLSWSLVWNFNH